MERQDIVVVINSLWTGVCIWREGGSQIVIRIGTFMETKYLLRFCHSRVQDFLNLILGGRQKD